MSKVEMCSHVHAHVTSFDYAYAYDYAYDYATVALHDPHERIENAIGVTKCVYFWKAFWN